MNYIEYIASCLFSRFVLNNFIHILETTSK